MDMSYDVHDTVCFVTWEATYKYDRTKRDSTGGTVDWSSARIAYVVS